MEKIMSDGTTEIECEFLKNISPNVIFLSVLKEDSFYEFIFLAAANTEIKRSVRIHLPSNYKSTCEGDKRIARRAGSEATALAAHLSCQYSADLGGKLSGRANA